MSRRRRRLFSGGLTIRTGLQLWLDAATTPTGAVATWSDKSGRGNNGTQGTGASQAICTANQQNGLNGLVFDGTNDFYTLPSALYSIPNGANTTFFVAKSNNLVNTQRLIAMSEAASSRFNLQYDFTANQISFQSRNAFGGQIAKTGITKDQTNIITARRSGTTQALSFNNNTEATNTNGADENGCDAATIGAFTDGTTNPFSGILFEVLIYNRSLSSAERTVVSSYLAAKWGISI